MSTAELEINSWVQTENTIVATQEWDEPAEEGLQPVEAAAEPDSGTDLPDDFWQEWFGLWR